MGLAGKVPPARFCWLSIGQMWVLKSNYDKKWLLTAFFKLKMSFLAKNANFFKNKKLITKWETFKRYMYTRIEGFAKFLVIFVQR